ncbi:MAG: hypothetical protein IJY04_07525, partial [Clostridia bacterium]|nr:hypothetical protein [Clostridia bacterium]
LCGLLRINGEEQGIELIETMQNIPDWLIDSENIMPDTEAQSLISNQKALIDTIRLVIKRYNRHITLII